MFINLFCHLLPFLNPMLMFVVLLSIFGNISLAEKQRIIIRECSTTCIIMLLIVYCGQTILSTLSISVAAVRLAGGTMLFISSLRILKIIPEIAKESVEIGLVVPISMPLFVGPGVISTLVSLSSTYSFLEIAPAVFFVVLLLCVSLLSLFIFCAELKPHVIQTLSGISGLILIFLSAEMILQALKTTIQLKI